MGAQDDRTGKASDVLRSWFSQVWNGEGVGASAISTLFAEDGVVHGLGEDPIVGPAQFAGFHEMIGRVFQDLRIEVLEAVDDGPRCYVRCHVTAQYRGEPIDFQGGTLATVRDGQIVEARDFWDFMRLLSMMDALPPDAFALAMGGRRFA